MAYRTLVIAPSDTGLEYSDDEVMAVVNALDAKMLAGRRATITGLLDIMSEGWDIVWVASHGDGKGIYLSDGIVRTSELTTLVRSTGAQLTVLNTCSSYDVAHAIHDEVDCALVCTLKPIPDREAFVTGTIFARQIAKGLDFFDAYELAKPGQNSTYRFFSGKGQVMPASYDRNRDNRSDGQDLGAFGDLIRRLEVIVNGSAQWNVEGLVPAFKRMELKIDVLTQEIAQLKANQRVNKRWLITLATICFLLLIAVVSLAYMIGGG